VSLLRNSWLHLVLRVALGGFFLYASVGKIADPAAFAKAVYQWQVTGPVLSNLVAVVLPWVEAIAGLMLIVGLWKREAALTIGLMLIVFIVAAGSVMARGIDVENCGCFAPAAAAAQHAERAWYEGVGWFLVVRNAVMLAAALLLAFVDPRRSATTAPAAGAVPAAPAS
jgi:uncharacterized membrane protein YphA (DoxX/SURF4 family)